ncbi:hypothetical protein C3K47_17795 [Solitalea longa]|uniref:Uncharacterized protein n=1 Tax=Solitalea longa TaxID=2079460 RepID=A0A2S4ZXE3_9SPHI|nr:hypothetical protein [Solitalea longa]POY34956.1 hypothetical protein C3K47_17795 [Solitalea longa]
MNNQLVYLVVITLLPIIPAYILYKTLPSKTSVKGPFKGLTLNLSGAFAAYFLLFLLLMGFIYFITQHDFNKETVSLSNDETIKTLKTENVELKQKLALMETSNQLWTMEGRIEANGVEQTKFFVDDGTSRVLSTGRFKVMMKVPVLNNKPMLPEAICIFNRSASYKVIDLNRNSSADLKTYGISFIDNERMIQFEHPVKLPEWQKPWHVVKK